MTTIRQALAAMGYHEVEANYWLKPVAFQLFAYGRGEWSCWFKPANGERPELMQRKVFVPGDYLRQLKEFEQWAKKDVYTDSHFELDLPAD